MPLKGSNPAGSPMATKHRLLPNERWAAKGIGDSPDNGPRTAGSIRMLSRYGPEGVRLMVAACADGLSGAPIIMVGAVVRAAFQHQPVAAVVSVFLLAAGLGGIVLGRYGCCKPPAPRKGTASKAHSRNNLTPVPLDYSIGSLTALSLAGLTCRAPA